MNEEKTTYLDRTLQYKEIIIPGVSREDIEQISFTPILDMEVMNPNNPTDIFKGCIFTLRITFKNDEAVQKYKKYYEDTE